MRRSIPYTGYTADGVVGGRYEAASTDDSAFFRTDFNLDPANTLMTRLSYDNRSNQGINVGGVNTPQWGFRLDESDVQLGAALTTVFSPVAHPSRLRLMYAHSSLSQDANSEITGVEHPSAQFRREQRARSRSATPTASSSSRI